MNWRPIRTAPKDRLILIKWLYGGHEPCVNQGLWVATPTLGQYNKGDRGPYPGHWEVMTVRVGWPDLYHYPLLHEVLHPTHWQPLPI